MCLILCFQLDDDNRSLSFGSQHGDDSEDSGVKVCNKPSKKPEKLRDLTRSLSEAADSIGKFANRKEDESSASKANESEDDDWLFCKRLYIKLRKLPDELFKEQFKLRTDSEIVRMVYGKAESCESLGVGTEGRDPDLSPVMTLGEPDELMRRQIAQRRPQSHNSADIA
jgi:hypothetical protein